MAAVQFISGTPAAPAELASLQVRDSAVHGLGAFATVGIPPGGVVGTYEGRRYAPSDEGVARDRELTYLFGLSDGTLIDGADGGNATRHINHSCEPNCQASEESDEDGELQIVIRARRRIRAGEELFIDYRLEVGDADPADFPCHCGSPRCRGTLAAASSGSR
jgi:uncharacterized protein